MNLGLIKKVLIIAIALTIIPATGALSFDDQSLRSRNTFGLFDLIRGDRDDYDRLMSPGDVVLIQGVRLYTNLHNSAGKDKFQLGGSLSIGPLGRFGFMYGRCKERSADYIELSNIIDPNSGAIGSSKGSGYVEEVETGFNDKDNDGLYDLTMTKYVDAVGSTSLVEDNYYLVYGLKIGRIFSIGLSYEEGSSSGREYPSDKNYNIKTFYMDRKTGDEAFEIFDTTAGENVTSDILSREIKGGLRIRLNTISLGLDAGRVYGSTEYKYNGAYSFKKEGDVEGMEESVSWSGPDLNDTNPDLSNEGVLDEFSILGAITLFDILISQFDLRYFYGELKIKNGASSMKSEELYWSKFSGIKSIESFVGTEDVEYAGEIGSPKGRRMSWRNQLKPSEWLSFGFGVEYEILEEESDFTREISGMETRTVVDYNGDGDFEDYVPFLGLEELKEEIGAKAVERMEGKLKQRTWSIPFAVEIKPTESLSFRIGAMHSMVDRSIQNTLTIQDYHPGIIRTTRADGTVNEEDGKLPDTFLSNAESYRETSSLNRYIAGLGYLVGDNLELNLAISDEEDLHGGHIKDVYFQITLKFFSSDFWSKPVEVGY